MKYLKRYESISGDIKRGDLIIDEDEYSRKSFIYLVLNDVYKKKLKIQVYCIGYMRYDSFVIINSSEEYEFKLGIHDIYKRENVRLLENYEKLEIFGDIYKYVEQSSDTFNYYYKEEIELIKNETGIDLRDMKEYKRIQIGHDMKKYNI